MTDNELQKGSLVSISRSAVYYNSGKPISPTVTNLRWYVSGISGSRVMIGKSEDGHYHLNTPVDAKYLTMTSD